MRKLPVRDFDVIVIGSGAAGLAAASTAGRRGARVLVVESERRIGGSSRLSDAFIQAGGTSIQRRDGISDTAGAMFDYYMAVNRWQLEPGIARAFCEDAPAVVEWLIQLGLKFGPIETAGIEPVPRGHPTLGNGEALIAALEAECAQWEVEFALDNRVDDVSRRDDLFQVSARGEPAMTAAVVFAAGGFAHNPTLIRKYLGDRMLAGDHPTSPAGPGSRGDALIIGERLGAGFAGHNRAHWVPGPLIPAEVVLVTREGRRFVDESADHSVRTTAANYHGHTHYAVFDERVRRAGAKHPFVSRTASSFLFNDEPYRPQGSPVENWVRAGELVTADSLRTAAAHAGIDSESVAATVEQYNAACEARRDVAFEKDPRHLVPIEDPPFYVLRVAPAMLVATFCGLRIDSLGRVLDKTGRPMRGLFAAGESSGGVIGDVYVGHGNSITSGLVFGRRAGENAATVALESG